MKTKPPLRILFDNNFESAQSESIQALVGRLSRAFSMKLNELEVPNCWVRSQSVDIEIKKSVLRSWIRYSKIGDNLALESARLAGQLNRLSDDSFFYTLLYPIIHLPDDESEAGVFHSDQVGGLRMNTCWTAVTDFQHPPISYIPFGTARNAVANRVLRGSYLTPKRREKPISVDQGDTLFWGGGFFHRGNFNVSQTTTCAGVIRISDKPMYLEPSRSFLPLKDRGTVMAVTTEPESNLGELCDQIQHLYNWTVAHRNIGSNLFPQVLSLLQDLKLLGSPMVSFSLCLLAQRFRTNRSIFFDANVSSSLTVYILDLMSLLCGPENLTSLQNVLNTTYIQSAEVLSSIESVLHGSDVVSSRSWAGITKSADTNQLPTWMR